MSSAGFAVDVHVRHAQNVPQRLAGRSYRILLACPSLSSDTLQHDFVVDDVNSVSPDVGFCPVAALRAGDSGDAGSLPFSKAEVKPPGGAVSGLFIPVNASGTLNFSTAPPAKAVFAITLLHVGDEASEDVTSSSFSVNLEHVLLSQKVMGFRIGTFAGQLGISVAVSEQDTSGYRRRLTEFFERHTPQAVATVDRIMSAPNATEVFVFTQLRRKLGLTDYRTRIATHVALYGLGGSRTTRQAEAVADALLAKWEKQEELLIAILVASHGPEECDVPFEIRLLSFCHEHGLGFEDCVMAVAGKGASDMSDFDERADEKLAAWFPSPAARAKAFSRLVATHGPEPSPSTYLFTQVAAQAALPALRLKPSFIARNSFAGKGRTASSPSASGTGSTLMGSITDLSGLGAASMSEARRPRQGGDEQSLVTTARSSFSRSPVAGSAAPAQPATPPAADHDPTSSATLAMQTAVEVERRRRQQAEDAASEASRALERVKTESQVAIDARTSAADDERRRREAAEAAAAASEAAQRQLAKAKQDAEANAEEQARRAAAAVADLAHVEAKARAAAEVEAAAKAHDAEERAIADAAKKVAAVTTVKEESRLKAESEAKQLTQRVAELEAQLRSAAAEKQESARWDATETKATDSRRAADVRDAAREGEEAAAALRRAADARAAEEAAAAEARAASEARRRQWEEEDALRAALVAAEEEKSQQRAAAEAQAAAAWEDAQRAKEKAVADAEQRAAEAARRLEQTERLLAEARRQTVAQEAAALALSPAGIDRATLQAAPPAALLESPTRDLSAANAPPPDPVSPGRRTPLPEEDHLRRGISQFVDTALTPGTAAWDESGALSPTAQRFDRSIARKRAAQLRSASASSPAAKARSTPPRAMPAAAPPARLASPQFPAAVGLTAPHALPTPHGFTEASLPAPVVVAVPVGISGATIDAATSLGREDDGKVGGAAPADLWRVLDRLLAGHGLSDGAALYGPESAFERLVRRPEICGGSTVPLLSEGDIVALVAHRRYLLQHSLDMDYHAPAHAGPAVSPTAAGLLLAWQEQSGLASLGASSPWLCHLVAVTRHRLLDRLWTEHVARQQKAKREWGASAGDSVDDQADNVEDVRRCFAFLQPAEAFEYARCGVFASPAHPFVFRGPSQMMRRALSRAGQHTAPPPLPPGEPSVAVWRPSGEDSLNWSHPGSPDEVSGALLVCDVYTGSCYRTVAASVPSSVRLRGELDDPFNDAVRTTTKASAAGGGQPTRWRGASGPVFDSAIVKAGSADEGLAAFSPHQCAVRGVLLCTLFRPSDRAPGVAATAGSRTPMATSSAELRNRSRAVTASGPIEPLTRSSAWAGAAGHVGHAQAEPLAGWSVGGNSAVVERPGTWGVVGGPLEPSRAGASEVAATADTPLAEIQTLVVAGFKALRSGDTSAAGDALSIAASFADSADRPSPAARAASCEAAGILAETIRKDRDAAKRHYRNALHFSPRCQSVLFRLGNVLETHAHDFHAALDCFDAAAAVESERGGTPGASAARRAALLRRRLATQ